MADRAVVVVTFEGKKWQVLEHVEHPRVVVPWPNDTLGAWFASGWDVRHGAGTGSARLVLTLERS
jgi:hypothetical protein